MGDRVNTRHVMVQVSPNFDEQSPTVLVIDDSQDVHRLLKARLRNEDLILVSAETGQEGLRLAADLKPAAILLDVDMPGMDGFEVLRALKGEGATMHIPVIVLSGLQSAQDKVTAFDLGAVDYITKPFDLLELRVRVRSALRLSSLLMMLADRAHVDGLTGLWNRAHFDHRLADEIAGCTRHTRPLSLAILDLDHFKSVNDTFGHPAGDAVLQGVARVLKRESRQNDVACRYGGEEFAVIMPDTTPEDAARVCERMRQSIASAVWTRHPERRVTASFGVAGARVAFTSEVHDWIDLADKSLYQAKRLGRDRVHVLHMDAPDVSLARSA